MRVTKVTKYFDNHCVVIIHWFEGIKEGGGIYRMRGRRKKLGFLINTKVTSDEKRD